MNQGLRSCIMLIGFVVTLAALAAGCNGGVRPTLVDDPPPTPEPPLQLELPAAPAGTPPLAPAGSDFPLEASVDDALIAWAADRNVPYVDSCALATPSPGQLCDRPTDRDTVRLLGPSADEVWYVVAVEQQDSFDFGTGYRVASVELAGG